MDKKEFTIIDYPKKGMNTGKYFGSSATIVANKVFSKLTKDLNFYNNMDGTKYLVFNIQDVNSKKIFPFIGTIVILNKPIDVNYKNNQMKITHRNIVAKFTSDMKEVFVGSRPSNKTNNSANNVNNVNNTTNNRNLINNNFNV